MPRSLGSQDAILLAVTLLLITGGTVMIYSSSSIMALERYQDGLLFLKKQLMFLLIGLGLLAVMSRIPYHRLRQAAYPGILLSAALLLLLFVPGLGIRRGGALRWLNLGFVSFQVTEVVKIAMVVFLASYLTRKLHQMKDFSRGVLVPLGITGALLGLILLQPDFGTAVIIATICLLMLYVAGSRITHLAGLVTLFIPFGVALILQAPYRWERVKAFLNPWRDPLHTGFHIIQSLLSFGSGGALGVGVGDGMQKLFYLPEPHTDFILAVIAEETGFLGVVTVLLLFVVFCVRGFLIAHRAQDLFGTLLAAGLTLVIALEAFINMAGVMGLIPLKGLALPFLSYGGTSLIMSLAAVGILLNISAQPI